MEELQVVSKHTQLKHMRMPNHIAAMKLLPMDKIKAKRPKFTPRPTNILPLRVGHRSRTRTYQPPRASGLSGPR
jgi:hypothetical protein